MFKFVVEGMSCGGCARSVTNALKGADPQAEVVVDLADKKVTVESSKDAATLRAAIEKAGFDVQGP